MSSCGKIMELLRGRISCCSQVLRMLQAHSGRSGEQEQEQNSWNRKCWQNISSDMMCQFVVSLPTRGGESETGERVKLGLGEIRVSSLWRESENCNEHQTFPRIHPFSLLHIKIYSVDWLSLPTVSKLDDIFNPRMRPEHTLGPPCCRSEGEIWFFSQAVIGAADPWAPNN